MNVQALFLDRDGTLIRDKHYLADPAGVELIPGVAEALARALEAGWQLFLHTNQSGIARGYYDEASVHTCHERLFELLGWERARFTEICIAPEATDEPGGWRKPSPRFAEAMLARYRLDPQACWMVGDRRSDWEAGLYSGMRSAAVLTGKPIGPEERQWLTANHIPLVPDLATLVGDLLASETSVDASAFPDTM